VHDSPGVGGGQPLGDLSSVFDRFLRAEHGGGTALSVEGGIPGNQHRLVCPNCGKVFFAWRPDDLPGQKIKCYFCRHEFADEAAQRPAATPITPPAEPAPPAGEPPSGEPAS